MASISLGELSGDVLKILKSKGGIIDADVRTLLRKHLLEHDMAGVPEEERAERLANIDAFLEGAPNIFVMSARSMSRALEHAERNAEQTIEGLGMLAQSLADSKDIYLMGGITSSVSFTVDALRAARQALLALAATAKFHGPGKKEEKP